MGSHICTCIKRVINCFLVLWNCADIHVVSFWLQDLKFRFPFFLFLFVSFVGLVHRTPYPSSSIESSNRVLVWKTAEQLKVQYLNNNDYYCDFAPFSFVGLNRCVSNTLSSSIEESNKIQKDCTSKKREALLDLKAVQCINGPVGSGKRWILKEKVKDLSGRRGGEQILVVCFNKPFSKSLKEEFKDCSGVVVKVFNELLSEITKKRCGSDQEMEENINCAVEILKGKTPEYDHIFVNECEHLIGEKWPVLFQKMWKGNEEVPGCKCKWFFYDTNQCGGWSDEGHRTAFPTTLELTRVLRTTGNIFDQCKKYLDPEKSCGDPRIAA